MESLKVDPTNNRRIKVMFIISWCSLALSVTNLIHRILNNKVEVKISELPVYRTDSEWSVGPWPASANLHSIESVAKKENMSIDDIKRLIATKKISPDPVPIRVTYTDYGIPKNYKIEPEQK